MGGFNMTATIQEYASIVDNLPSLFLIRNENLDVVFYNETIKNWMHHTAGITIEGLTYKDIQDKIKNIPESSEVYTVVKQNLDETRQFIKLNNGSSIYYSSYTIHGEITYLQITLYKVYFENNVYYCAMGSNITSLFNEIESIETEISMDELTKLYNRKILNSISCSKNDIFLYIDLDNFKIINDTYGHQVGDLVLIQFSDLLKNTFRMKQDYIIRLGGDEFLIIIKDDNKFINMEEKIKELNNKFNKKFLSYISFGFDFSFGYSNYETSISDTLNLCDSLMYKNKQINKVRNFNFYI